MKFSKNAWEQLKGKTADDLIAALEKGGYVLDEHIKTERIYRYPDGRRVSIHYHRGKQTYGPSLLKALLDDIGWTESEMRKLKLIK